MHIMLTFLLDANYIAVDLKSLCLPPSFCFQVSGFLTHSSWLQWLALKTLLFVASLSLSVSSLKAVISLLMILAPGIIGRRIVRKEIIFFYCLFTLLHTLVGKTLKPKPFCTDAQNSLHLLLTCFCLNPSLSIVLLL